MTTEFDFRFGMYPSRVLIREELPSIREIMRALDDGKETGSPALAVCDTNTEPLARAVMGKDTEIPLVVLESGERNKSWESVETILRAGKNAGLGRDGLFIGIGGGVIGDLTAFAASIYMRGARLCLVSTTLLAMVDAGAGGKTGIDLLGLKNLAGTFYPAGLVVMPLGALDSLPQKEWKSGMAELIKTAILDSDDFLALTKKLAAIEKGEQGRTSLAFRSCLMECISRSVSCKGRIVEADPRELGQMRPLLNLGHTFGHALESAAGLGSLSHGEAVAWGIARACELGSALKITPPERGREIRGILDTYGYETAAPHSLANSAASIDTLMQSMRGDKKVKAGKLRFIVPGKESAQIVSIPEDSGAEDLLRGILDGTFRRSNAENTV